jgi:adenosylcobinamide-GDP ribazoletransferase
MRYIFAYAVYQKELNKREIILVIIKRIILMIQFFTTIPVRKRLDVQAKDFGKGLVFAPFVGLTLGYIIYGIFYLSAELFTIEIAPVFIFIVYILLTGGLHLDGLGDTFDGLFSGKPKDRIIEIMHDSRLGTNALLAVLSVVLLNTFFFFQFKNPDNVYMVIVLFPVSGRIGSLIGCSISRYAGEKDSGSHLLIIVMWVME